MERMFSGTGEGTVLQRAVSDGYDGQGSRRAWGRARLHGNTGPDTVDIGRANMLFVGAGD